MSFVESANEHHNWLSKFAGDWRVEVECTAGPGKPNIHSVGTEKGALLGDLWFIGNSESAPKEGEQGAPMKSQFVIGYDPNADSGKGAYVGSWVASTMTRLWAYQGSREGNILYLRGTAPSFIDPSKMVPMVDEFELIDDNHKVMTSKIEMADGVMVPFMWIHYYRIQN